MEPTSPTKIMCPICHSRKFYKRDGMLFCDLGHQMQGYIQENIEFTCSGRRLTTVKRKTSGLNEDKGKKKLKSELKLCGKRGKYMAYRACQHILQQFITILIEKLHFPKQLDETCRELWLMLAAVQDLWISNTDTSIVNASPSININDHAGTDFNVFSQPPMSQMATKPLSLETSKTYEPPSTRVPERTNIYNLDISHSLVVIYVGCLFLKIPIFINDLVCLCAQNILPYFSAFHILLPQELSSKVPIGYLHALNLKSFPKVHKLSHLISQFVALLKGHFQVSVPPLQIEGLSYRLTMAWGLPISFYSTLLSYLKTLKIDGHWQGSFTDQYLCSKDPEIRLMALCIYLLSSKSHPHSLLRIPGLPKFRYPDMIQFAKYEPYAFAHFHEAYLHRQHDSIDVLRQAMTTKNGHGIQGWLVKNRDQFKHLARTEEAVIMALTNLTGIEKNHLESPVKWMDDKIRQNLIEIQENAE